MAGGRALGAPGAPGAPDVRTEKAREHYLQGDAYYKLDKFAPALQEYEQAYLAKADPSFLYNIAQCHRLMGDRAEAIKYYRRYLKDAPNAPNRGVAEKHIKDLEAAALAASGAEPTHDKPPAALWAPSPTPPSSASPAPMPPPQVSQPSPGAQALALNAPPPPLPDAPSGVSATSAVPPSSDENHPIYTKWWFWTGVAAVVAGGVLIALAAAKSDPACPSWRMCQ